MDRYQTRNSHFSMLVSFACPTLDSFVSLLKPHSTLGGSNTIISPGGGGLGMFRLNPSQRMLEFVVTFDGIGNVGGTYRTKSVIIYNYD